MKATHTLAGAPPHRLKKRLEDISRLSIEKARDPLHASSSCESANRGLCDAVDRIAQVAPEALRSALVQPQSKHVAKHGGGDRNEDFAQPFLVVRMRQNIMH